MFSLFSCRNIIFLHLQNPLHRPQNDVDGPHSYTNTNIEIPKDELPESGSIININKHSVRF